MVLRELLATACIHTTLAAHPAKVYSQVLAAPHVPVSSHPAQTGNSAPHFLTQVCNQGFFEANPLGPGLDHESWQRYQATTTAHGPPAKPPPPPPPGTYYAMCFTDNAILQRAPAKAALFGRVFPLPPSGATVEVTVTPALGGKSSFPAEMYPDGTWKVLLPPYVHAVCTHLTSPPSGHIVWSIYTANFD